MNQNNYLEKVTYWDTFYEKNKLTNLPSSFAIFCLENFEIKQTLLDVGCGNGRDSFFFLENKINVIGVDNSEEIIKDNLLRSNDNINFIWQNIIDLNIKSFKNNVSTIYSRFFVHSLSENDESVFFSKAYKILPKKGLFLFEARTVNDPMYGIGESLGGDAFSNGHYRRFLRVKETTDKIVKLGFKILFLEGNKTDAWYKDDHAVVLRIVAEK